MFHMDRLKDCWWGAVSLRTSAVQSINVVGGSCGQFCQSELEPTTFSATPLLSRQTKSLTAIY